MGQVLGITHTRVNLLVAPQWVAVIRGMLQAGGWGLDSSMALVVELLYRGLYTGVRAVCRQCQVYHREFVDRMLPDGH